MDTNCIVKDRLKFLRKTEGLTQDEFSELIDIAVGTVRNFEQIGTISFNQLHKIFEVPRFSRYFMWFFKEQAFPSIGQISPDMMQEIKAQLKVQNPDFNKSDEVSNEVVKEYCSQYQSEAPIQPAIISRVVDDVSKAVQASLEKHGLR